MLNTYILVCDYYYQTSYRIKVLLTSGLRTKGSQASEKKKKILRCLSMEMQMELKPITYAFTQVRVCQDLYLNQVLAPHEQVLIPGKISELSERNGLSLLYKNAFYNQIYFSFV